MGQLLSREATTSKPYIERTPSTPRSSRQKLGKRSDATLHDGRESRKSVHWDRASTRTGKAAGAQGSRPHINVLREVDGNVGSSRRHSNHGSHKLLADSARSKDGLHSSVRKSDAQHRVKDYHHQAKPHTSKTKLHTKPRHQTKECIICTDTRSLRRFPDRPPTETCSHNSDVCRRCLRTWLESEFRTKIWNEMTCPICSARLHHGDMRAFAPKDVYRRYDKLTTKAMYDSIPNYRWCIAKGCKEGQVHSPGSPRFRCMTCRRSHCVVHGVMWHKGETCAEYNYRTKKHIKKEEEAASKKMIAETTKKCPGCKRSIEKSFGCDHMTCSKCKHEFCWQCLAPYAKKGVRRVIHRQGCAYHNPEWDED